MVSGILFLSFRDACTNLEFYLDATAERLLADMTHEGWYPLDQYVELLKAVSERYSKPGVVLEKVGAAMMFGWYHFGPGKEIIASGADFLRHQTGSEGYHSLIKGPTSVVGDFSLTALDEANCRAQVKSTTPFDKNLERGVLQGGLSLVGDMRLIEVDNSADETTFEVRYQRTQTISDTAASELEAFLSGQRTSDAANLSPEALGELGIRHRELEHRHARQEEYWQAINETLSGALLRNQQQQEALRRSNEALRAAKSRAEFLKSAIVDLATNAIITFDHTDRIVEFNPSAERIFGRKRDDVIGHQSATEILPRPFFERMARAAPQNLPERTEILRPDGQRVPVDFLIKQVEIDGQNLSTTFVRDVSELVLAEQEIDRQREALHQSEKLTALGSLLSGVAHELNNPLSIVAGRALMLEQENAHPELQSPLSKIRSAAERCSRIVRSFLAMARQQTPERETVNANTLIADTIELLDYQLRTSGITVSTSLDPALPQISADATQFSQVLSNLLINAQQALAETDGDRRILITSSSEGCNIVISVHDSGPGVPQDIRQRIFEPFFTTKNGTGSGVGLSLSHGLIAAHGGALTLDDAQDGGARFVITLPATTCDTEPGVTEAAEAPKTRTLSVLIIDDEADIADMAADMIRPDGHEPHLAYNGQAGLDLIAQRSFDVVLCDLNMPGLSGQDVYETLRKTSPEYIDRIVFFSGDILGAATQKFISDAGRPFLEKPFTPKDLRAVLANAAG